MGGPDAPSDVLAAGEEPAGTDSDVMSSGADRPADVLAGGREHAGDSDRTMGTDAPDTGSDVLADEDDGPAALRRLPGWGRPHQLPQMPPA